MSDERRNDKGLSTADLANAAEQSEERTTAAPGERVEEREVAREASVEPGAAGAESRSTPLLASDVVSRFREQWTDIQAGFVDEPRRAVERADGLVAEAIKRLAESFANERAKLEGQWDRGGDVSTEDLRQALQRYRSFFSRLLAI
ncbi:MAG TPA: hypothetical protein VFS44_05245 [Gemmatimonadaceae bacterium]|nr:hypothetical protein [Gemmatimonadaceae bacterium]